MAEGNHLKAMSENADRALAAMAHVEELIGPPQPLAHSPTWDSDWSYSEQMVAQRLHQVAIERHAELEHLREEPFFARVKVRKDGGQEAIFYFSRFQPPSISTQSESFVSTRCPLGRILSFAPGETVVIQIPAGPRQFDILSKLVTRPSKDGGQWDGVRNEFYFGDDEVFSIKSLRSLLQGLGIAPSLWERQPASQFTVEKNHQEVAKASIQLPGQTIGRDQAQPPNLETGRPIIWDEALASSLEAVLASAEAEEEGLGLQHGIPREVIQSARLESILYLDKVQDEIQRLPIDSRIMISGPPGTGKTTTLIKRLALKRYMRELPEEERRTIEAINEHVHENSWIAFTPSELLKQFVQNAFSQEGIAAPNERIQTWDQFRKRLLWECFSDLLASKRGFVFDPNRELLTSSTADALISLFMEVRTAWLKEVRREFEEIFDQLKQQDRIEARIILNQAERTFRSGYSLGALLGLLDGRTSKALEDLQKHQRSRVDDLRREILKPLHRHRSDWMDQLVHLVQGLEASGSKEADPMATGDSELDEETERDLESDAPKKRALAVFHKALASMARTSDGDGRPAKGSRAEFIWKWMAAEAPSRALLGELHAATKLLRSLNRLRRPVHIFFQALPRSYRAFRRGVGRKFFGQAPGISQDVEGRTLSGHEADILLLLLLQGSQVILNVVSRERLESDIILEPVRPMAKFQFNQVLVDEVTDFSPIQVAAMARLAHPRLKSFLACGDLRQRVTHHGLAHHDHIKWAEPSFQVFHFRNGYRQSRKLTELAKDISIMDGATPEEVFLPRWIGIDGIAPVLSENRKGHALFCWIGDRIHEIQTASGKLPSVAIFVDGDEAIQPVVEGLAPVLREQSIGVEACNRGKILGDRYDIRVFDVQHIKGLEFEAVFFLDIDKTAAAKPDLVNKFLYVGSTRAATYFGMAVGGRLPAVLEPLRHHFKERWSQ